MPTENCSEIAERPQLNLEEFRKLVDECAATKSRAIISNSGPPHFAVVMASMLHNAVRKVVIYANHLSRCALTDGGEPLWANPDLGNAAQSFLRNPNTQLGVLVRYKLDLDPAVGFESHPFLAQVINDTDRKGSITLVVANEPLGSKHPLHHQNFAIMDSDAYRLELDTNGVKAIATFNDPAGARRLSRTLGDMIHQIRVSGESQISRAASFFFEPSDRIRKYPHQKLSEIAEPRRLARPA